MQTDIFRKYVNADLKEASHKEGIGIAILITVLIISPIIIVLVRNAVATIQMYAVNLSEKAKELNREKKKSDALLFQMLPTSVAQQLKQAHQVRDFSTFNVTSNGFRETIYIFLFIFFFLGSCRILRISYRLLLRHCWIHRNCCP